MKPPEAVLAAMRQSNNLFDTEVIRKQNLDTLDRLYTVKARVLPPVAPMVEGRNQIKLFWQKAIGSLGLKSAKLKTIDAEAAGDSIVEVGRASLTRKDGQTFTDKYVVQWKQEQGTWKWSIDIWNMDQ